MKIIDVSIVDKVKVFTKNNVKHIPGIFEKALWKAGGLVKKEAGRLSPNKKIANAFKVMVKHPKGMPETHVGLKKRDPGFVGKFLESGARRHRIEPAKWGGHLAFPVVAGKFNVKMKKSGKIK